MRHRDDAKEEAIVEAAIRLINKNGFASTSISKIAKEAGVSPATIYVYFESKEDLLNNLYLMTKESMIESIGFHYDQTAGWEVNFKHFFDSTCRFMMNNRDSLAFLEQCWSNPMISAATLEQGAKMFTPVFELFQKGVAAGAFKPLDTQVTMALVFLPMMNYIRGMQNESAECLTGLEQLRDCTWDAIKK